MSSPRVGNPRVGVSASCPATIWLGTKQQLDKLSFTELSLLSARVYDLGFLLDGQLITKDDVSAQCRSCFWQLRQLRLVRSSLTSDTAKILVHALIISRLDYRNSLLYGVGDGLLKKLQAAQNAAARVVTGARKFDRITTVHRDLHWLPVRQRIKYKLAMTVYKCLRGLAPTYLADDCLPISAIAGKRHLRSASTGMLSVPWTTTSRSSHCNSLPSDVRSTSEGPPVWLIGSASEDYL